MTFDAIAWKATNDGTRSVQGPDVIGQDDTDDGTKLPRLPRYTLSLGGAAEQLTVSPGQTLQLPATVGVENAGDLYEILSSNRFRG